MRPFSPANHGCPKVSTPLIEFVKRKQEERRANFKQKQESKQKRDFDKRKVRDEEKKKKRERVLEWQREKRLQKEKEQEKKGDREKEKETVPASPIKVRFSIISSYSKANILTS